MLVRLLQLLVFSWFGVAFAIVPSLNQTSADALLRQQKQQIRHSKPELKRVGSVKVPKFKSNLFKKHQHVSFILNKVNLHGDAKFKVDNLEAVFSPFYGKRISLSKLQKLVEKTTDKMLAKGFILSHAYLPEQTIDKGVVKVNIVQGFISNYQVVGNLNHRNKALLDQYIAPIVSAKVFNSKQLERALLLINMLPGVRVKSILSPDKNTPDAAVLTLFISQKMYNVIAKIDNWANRLQGREQVFIGATSYANFLGGELSAWFSHSLESNNSRSLTLSYKRFLSNDNGIISVGLNISDSLPDYSTIGLPTLDDQGFSKELNIRYSYSLLLTRDYSDSVFGLFRINYADMEQLNTNSLTFKDKVRSIKLGNILKFNDVLQGFNKFMLSVTQGIDGLGANNDMPSRADGVLNFTKFNLLFSRLQPLTAGLNWKLLFVGQHSLDPLLVSEEFNLGGNGYDFGEIAGDRGYSVYNEFNYNLNPRLFQVQGYVFHYVGSAFNINSVAQLSRESLASVGVGGRFIFNKNVSANLYVAKPLTRAVALEGSNNLRLFFSLNFNMSN